MSVTNRYSLNRKDKKLAGVCSTLGEVFNIDPTFIRIGFVAAALLISWKLALIAYVAAGIYLHIQKRRVMSGRDRPSEFERMGLFRPRPSLGPRHAHQARRQRPPDDGDRPPPQQPE